jgi:hypothetical protein
MFSRVGPVIGGPHSHEINADYSTSKVSRPQSTEREGTRTTILDGLSTFDLFKAALMTTISRTRGPARTEDLEILVAARPEGEEQSAGCEEEKGQVCLSAKGYSASREGIQRVPRPIETFQAHKV